MLLLVLMLQQQQPRVSSSPDDPTFDIVIVGPKGTNASFGYSAWQPYCPAGTDLLRMDVQPVCYWGNTQMIHKPTVGQFKCVKHKWYKAKPKKCGVDQYFNVGIGVQ